MTNEDFLNEALMEWEVHWRRGEDLSAECLCADHSELCDSLRRRIEALKATDWLCALEDEAGMGVPTAPAPAPARTPGQETALPDSSLTCDELVQSLATRGLLTADECQRALSGLPAELQHDPKRLARQLIAQGKLTVYQASVILEQRRDPLLIDKYVILDVLDSGGMGLVLKALHKSMERIVALKMLPHYALDSPQRVARFRREVRIAAQLAHPNIVTAHDADQSDGVHFLVMEYVQGQNLANLVKNGGPVSVADAINFMLQSAQGLAHAHARGVVHRDVKPANLILDQMGTIKVVDVGLAHINRDPIQADSSADHLTLPGDVMGTAAFMSPEQALDVADADCRSDVYSLGATLFYLLAGRPPYEESTPMKTLLAHREAEIPSLRAIRADVPEQLDGVVQRALSKRPEERYQSMEEVISALQRCAADSNIDVSAVSTTAEQWSPSVRMSAQDPRAAKFRIRRVLLGSVSAVIVVASILALIHFNKDEQQGKVELSRNTSVIPSPGSTTKKPATGGEEPATLKLKSVPTCVVFGDQGKTLIAGLENGFLQAWDVETHRSRMLSGKHERSVLCLATSPNGKLLASGSYGSLDSTIRIWDLQTGKAKSLPSEHHSYVLAVAFARDGKTLVSSSYHRFSLWHLESEVGEESPNTNLGGIQSLAFTPNGKTLALAGENGEVELWSFDENFQSAQQPVTLSGHVAAVTSLAISPDGMILASGAEDHTIKLWDLKTAKERVTLTGHEKKVNHLAFSADGKLLVSAGADKAIKLWALETDTGNASLLATLHQHDAPVTSVAFSPDGNILASAGKDLRIYLWNVPHLLAKAATSE